MTYTIRLATKDDVNALAELKHKVWSTTYRNIYPDEMIDNFDYPKHESKFSKIIATENVHLYVVEDNGSLVGYMSYGKPMRKYKDYTQEIGLLYVLKSYQGKGIGKALFDLAYNKIKKDGYEEFFISCNKYNKKAHGFYEKMGGVLIDTDEDNLDKTIPQVKFVYKVN